MRGFSPLGLSKRCHKGKVCRRFSVAIIPYAARSLHLHASSAKAGDATAKTMIGHTTTITPA
ncbi:MAG: hypothetical protein DMG64_16335 [Acidobacteria bacterium]|nr:MAG: hypothetical protein DMG64_16335 [Acidobacteriota bacterium]